MLIIVKDNQITGVDKKLLNILNSDLTSVSKLIESLNLQISSIKKNPLNINGLLFNINETDLLCVENIKVYDLVLTQNTQQDESETFEPLLDNTETEELIKTESPFEETSVNLINHDEDFLVIPQESYEEQSPSLDLDIGIISQEDSDSKTEEKSEEKSIVLEENKIEFETPQNIETPISELNSKEEGMIEISFEDDLEEIRNILNMNKEEFNQVITSELKKASKELGIDYTELAKWYNQLIQQIKDEKLKIYNFLEKKDYNNLHKSYHKLKGAALNLRLSKIALVLKKLDELAKNKETIEKIKKVTDELYSLIENETISLSSQTTESNISSRNTDKHIENIILKTIQSYLKTQNEAQFQKDKKYIEKLLNTKINSMKDLKRTLKGL